MTEKLINFIVRQYIGTYLTGWNTKFGAAATTILALGTMLGCLVAPLQMASDGDYLGAYHTFDKDTFLAAAGGITFIKMYLGGVNKVEKAAAPGTELHAEVMAEEAKQLIAEAKP